MALVDFHWVSHACIFVELNFDVFNHLVTLYAWEFGGSLPVSAECSRIKGRKSYNVCACQDVRYLFVDESISLKERGIVFHYAMPYFECKPIKP